MMRALGPAAVAALSLLASGAYAAPSFDRAVLDEINEARTQPHLYAEKLRALPRTEATEEAIAFLERQAPLPSLKPDERLARAAAAHAADDGERGNADHRGSDGSMPNTRAQAEGLYSMVFAEVISIAEKTPRGVVAQLIIDIPGPRHPHRADLFDPLLTRAGVGCGPNAKYGTMCVVDLSAGAVE